MDASNWKRATLCAFTGAVLGGVVFETGRLPDVWQYLLAGALAGMITGLVWNPLSSFVRRTASSEWQVSEAEVAVLGQKWKLVSSGGQRRVAWTIFVEIATRVATQAAPDQYGDDGAALKSLYELFQHTRAAISEMAPSVALPSRSTSTNTVEAFALAMLNEDIRPFLSKWHPIWEEWRHEHPNEMTTSWEHHQAFRDDLRIIQTAILDRAQGFAKIVGVPDGTAEQLLKGRT